MPTVVDDGDLPDSGRLAYIGTNWTQVGVAQAKKMMEMLPDGGKLAMMSIIAANNMREGVAGFTAYLEANGGGKYEIVANEDDGGDAQKAAQVTAALLAAHPDIAGIAGFDSESGAGIVTALREAGKNPGDIKVTAMEQTPDFFKTAKEGWVDGIVVQNRELFIYYAVKMLHDFKMNGLKTAGLPAADGGRPIPDSLDTGVLLVTKDNVDGVLTAARREVRPYAGGERRRRPSTGGTQQWPHSRPASASSASPPTRSSPATASASCSTRSSTRTPAARCARTTSSSVDLVVVSHAAFDHLGDTEKIAAQYGCPVVCGGEVKA